MALQTLPKQFFVYDLIQLNTKQESIFSTNVRLKFYFNDEKIYVDRIIFNVVTMQLTICHDNYGQYTLDLLKLPSEVTYEFNY